VHFFPSITNWSSTRRLSLAMRTVMVVGFRMPFWQRRWGAFNCRMRMRICGMQMQEI
jgi:hypothetical protein